MGGLSGWESRASAPVTVPVLCDILYSTLERLDMHETGARAIGSPPERAALGALKTSLQAALPADHCGRYRQRRPRPRKW